MEPPSGCHRSGRDPLETQKATRRWLSLFRNSISHAERRVFRIYRSFSREFSRAATLNSKLQNAFASGSYAMDMQVRCAAGQISPRECQKADRELRRVLITNHEHEDQLA